MASASIESTVTAPVAKPSVIGASRDDLELTDVVLLNSVNVGTAYAWSIAYAPEGSTAAFSGSDVAQSPGSFTVDKEGSYLIRLLFTDGTGSTEQFVRLRALTVFGSLALVAAGEGVYSVPVPVDITAAGWADEQNGNLLSLLSLVQTATTSGRLVYVDPSEGDYQTIQEGIDYAQSQTPSSASPWVVLVRPGTYTEDLTLYPWVHVFGWPGGQYSSVVKVLNDTTSHTAALALSSDQLHLANLYFERSDATSDALLEVSGAGFLFTVRCVFLISGAGTPQGPGVNMTGTSKLRAFDSRFSSTGVTSSDTYALQAESGGDVTLRDCRITLRGLKADEGSSISLRDCSFSVGVGADYGILSNTDAFVMEYCTVEGATLQDVAFNPTGAAIAGDLKATIRWCRLGGLIFDTTGVVGTTELSMGAVDHGSLSFPGGSPASLVASVPASTIFFDNVVTGITAENVQDALDEIWGLATAVQTLDDAYDGGDPGPTGSGRTIVADAGAVQIVDASSPSDPVPPSNTNGNLEVVGSIKTGAITKPEQVFDPNPYGNGPLILLGREIWSNEGPLGSSALILANSTGSPSYHNYNLRVGTKTADGGGLTGIVGRVILQGGDSLANPVEASSLYLQAGRGVDAAGGDGGSLFLAAGDSVAGTKGYITLVRPEDGTPADVTAAGAFVGGVTGQIRFATNQGALEVDIDAADNLAAVLVKLNASGLVVAVDSGGGVIKLTTVALGPVSEVFFLNADSGVDAALGTFAGQTMTQGTWPSYMEVEVSAANEITFGPNAANPMIYNAVTGKLTVPGPIDPTYLIQTDSPPFSWVSGKGALWVSDGSGGTTLGDLYYIHEFGGPAGTALNISGGLALPLVVEDEATPLGSFNTMNFTGPGVTAVDAGGGEVTVTITSGGGLVQGVTQDIWPASSFTWTGSVSQAPLSQSLDSAALLAGLIVLYRNGVADMNNVGPAAPTTDKEYRITGGNVEVGADVSGETDTYRLVYPRT